jgi:uncharacterized protein YijF (DUF1287 family)
MVEEIAFANPLEKIKKRKRSSRKVKPSTEEKSMKKKGQKKARKAARKAAAKPVKKSGKKKGRKSALKGRKQIVKIRAKGLRSESAPTILLVGQGGKVEPTWFKYAQMTPAKRSRRPSIPTDIRVGNLVGWKTDGGKDRLGVVQEFLGDSAVVGMGGKNEIIRIARLTRLASKVKEL